MTAEESTAAANTTEEEDIREPHEHDVLCGRGGSINSWKGNERFRNLVEKRKRVYLTARFKREKRLIASSIVEEIQSLKPPGRFLSRNAKKGTWFVIDDDKARDKVSQALRENAPTIRAEIETEINEQRAEIQKNNPPPHNPHYPPPPAGAPYYPHHPAWGPHYSYYGYPQQAPPPGTVPHPPPPPAPPQHEAPAPSPITMAPPPNAAYQQHQHHAMYAQYPCHNTGSPLSSQTPSPTPMQAAQSGPPTSCPPASVQQTHVLMQSPPQLLQQQQEYQQQQQQQQQQRQQQQQQQPQYQPVQQSSIFNFSFGASVAPAPISEKKQKEQQPPQAKKKEEPDDDDQSIFGAMSAIFPSSIASWTKDAFSFAGGASVSSHRDDNCDNVSVASKPIHYVHQPVEEKSAGSGSGSNDPFNDGRSISGRVLDPTKKNRKPPRIMHSSQISYPRRPKKNMTPTNGKPTAHNGSSTAPVSSVNLADHSEGMISYLSTDGMGSIMEDGPLNLGDFSHSSFGKSALSQEVKAAQAPAPGMVDYRRIKKPFQRPEISSGIPEEASNSMSNSMLSVVANQIVMGMESLDTGSIVTGCDTVGTPLPFENDNTMAVEIEGQEVQLVDMMDSQQDIPGDNSVVENRTPPNSQSKGQIRQAGWASRVGGCHSFLGDSLPGASLFSGNNAGEISAASSMEMDVSSNTEDPFSSGNSIGGASLCRVFDTDSVAPERNISNNSAMQPQNNPHVYKKFPSWGLTLMNDAEEGSVSFGTKGGEKLVGGSLLSMNSGDKNNNKDNGMVWETQKKE